MSKLEKLVRLISEIDPISKKPEDQAKVLVVASRLNATDKEKSVRTRQLEEEGVNTNALYRAEKNGLMEKSRVHSVSSFILDERTRAWLMSDSEVTKALNRERQILYEDIDSNPKVKEATANILNKDRDSKTRILADELEHGNLKYRQVPLFDELIRKLYLKLGKETIRSKRIGWRTSPYYWNLSGKAKEILQRLDNS